MSICFSSFRIVCIIEATLNSEWNSVLISSVSGLEIFSPFCRRWTANAIWSAIGNKILRSIFPKCRSASFKIRFAIWKYSGWMDLISSAASPLEEVSCKEYTVQSAGCSKRSPGFFPNPTPFPSRTYSLLSFISRAITPLWFNTLHIRYTIRFLLPQ